MAKGIRDYKGPVSTRGPQETAAVKQRVRQLTQAGNDSTRANTIRNPDRTITSTRASGAEVNRATEAKPAMRGQGAAAERKFIANRTKASMRAVNRAGARDAAEAAASAAAKSATRRAAVGAVARGAARLASGPVGAAVGVADVLRQGVQSQADQNRDTVNTRNTRKTRTNAGPTATGRGGRR